MIGGLAPDIDQSTADLWRKIPAGTVIGKLVTPLFGGHRFLSHSLLGLLVFGWGSKYLLETISSVLLVDITIVWWAFMIGFFSHLVMDTFTKDGVPWLFPIPIRFGIPPLKFLRIKTGGFVEKALIFPGLIAVNIYMYYNNYGKFLDLLRHYIK